MKIGILTQPLQTNYGGLLQAYALQKFLRDMGHEVLTVDYSRKPPTWRSLYHLARRCVGKFLMGRNILLFPKPIPKESGMFMRRFVEENIRTTKKIFAPARKSDFFDYGFEAFVVGSDQCWRPVYSPHMPTFFLDFLGEDKHVRRIAYAASFGGEKWEFSKRKTKKFSALAKKFHAISVREDSGSALCEKHLGVSAEHLLDPTMLLSKEDYCAIIAKDEEHGFLEKRENGSRLFIYVLDASEEKSAVASRVAERLNLEPDEIMPSREKLVRREAVYPPVSAWLRGFRDSEFIVTDSFHGCVFSIIFNKPFIAIGNASRGMSRFHSLLKMFDLESRLFEVGGGQMDEPIDWANVDARLNAFRRHSVDFLRRALEKQKTP